MSDIKAMYDLYFYFMGQDICRIVNSFEGRKGMPQHTTQPWGLSKGAAARGIGLRWFAGKY